MAITQKKSAHRKASPTQPEPLREEKRPIHGCADILETVCEIATPLRQTLDPTVTARPGNQLIRRIPA